MSVNLLVRRTHLYLAMFLLPWFLVYGVSSLPFSHGQFFKGFYDDGTPDWTVRIDRPYELEIPPQDDLRSLGAQVLQDNGLEGAFGAYRSKPQQLDIYTFSFWKATRITYFVDQKRLLVEDQRFRWDHFLTGMHARGGFEQESLLHDAWGVVVDLVCLSILTWVATGIYMWWKIPHTRWWGYLALGSGIVSYAMFLIGL
ncbi:MAG: hypothetical protein AB1898_25755 [Acidobacteriota bacterium]